MDMGDSDTAALQGLERLPGGQQQPDKHDTRAQKDVEKQDHDGGQQREKGEVAQDGVRTTGGRAGQATHERGQRQGGGRASGGGRAPRPRPRPTHGEGGCAECRGAKQRVVGWR